MKVVILAGGYGTRLSEYTGVIPKPMVPIGGRPIIWHIMKYYAKFGFNDFVIALGYKSEVIKEYFLNYKTLNSDFKVDLKTGEIQQLNDESLDWNVTLVDTGKDTMTGGRIKRLQHILGNEEFLLTYGDGLSDVDLNELLKHHKQNNNMVTLTAVRPAARFGELELSESGTVESFQEKPQMQDGWINGGFFVVNPSFLNYVSGDHEMLEREPLDRIVKEGKLGAFKHNGFWQCMDTKRDHEALEKIWAQGPIPWE